jgi:hypothetical protein
MSQPTDLSRTPDYFAARAAEERRIADAATDLSARAIHLEMAKRYAELAKGARESKPLKTEQPSMS